MYILDFERPIIEINARIDELKKLPQAGEVDITHQIEDLTKTAQKTAESIYSNLSIWQKTQLARHPDRITTLDFIEYACTDFIPLHGDRHFKDDPAIIGGFARLGDHKVMIIGHQKGKNTTENVKRNFGMPYPEGYRKALRLMKLAEKFSLPVITMIDTPGAYPGVEAEERGQSEAIAVNLREMAGLKTPSICIVVGEGGSGGALALGVTNKVLMLEHAMYSVISPEGCAGILWGDGSRAEEAAKALKYTASYLKELNIIDDIIKEPFGGAHRFLEESAENIKQKTIECLQDLSVLDSEALVSQRYDRFRRIGEVEE